MDKKANNSSSMKKSKVGKVPPKGGSSGGAGGTRSKGNSGGGGGSSKGGSGSVEEAVQDGCWDCSVCTYRNTQEAFKCLMCDVRKGTSTRKPRLNQAMVAQQVVAVAGVNSSNTGGSGESRSSGPNAKKIKNSSSSRSSSVQRSRGVRRPARLRDIDRSSAQAREVTVNSVTVVITEYKRRTPQQNNVSDNEDSSDTRP